MPKKGNTSSLDINKLLEERLKSDKENEEKVAIRSVVVIPKKDAEILVDYIVTKTDYKTVSDFIKDILYKHINTYKRKMKKKTDSDNVDATKKVEEDDHEDIVKSQIDYGSGLQFSS